VNARPRRAGSLADLQRIKKELAAQTQAHAKAAADQAQAEKTRHAQRNLFQAAIGAVQPLAAHSRTSLRPPPPRPVALQFERDEAAALQEACSDEVDISSLLDTDDRLSFRRSGIGPDVTRRLRRGEWTVQRQIDLHGLRSDEARSALSQFIRTAQQQGIRCVRVVHGKGLGSPGKTPVLKDKVHRWLVQRSETLAFVQAAPAQGGSGALLVLLQPARAN
jgi:DNA-nicking Smr family endonuclease